MKNRKDSTFLLILMVCLLMAQFTFAGGERDKMEDTALVIIDIQNFYFSAGSAPLVGSEEASRKAVKLLEFFRQKNRPVFHVQHLPQAQAGKGRHVTGQYAIHQNVTPLEDEPVIVKHHVNCFRDTDLLTLLRKQKVKTLVICGMQTHMCLEAGVRAAADFGFKVSLVEDACATRDLTYADITVSAAQVHTSTLATLNRSYAEILTLETFLAANR